MNTINDVLYTIESLEMSKDNTHLTHFRANLRAAVALIRAGQAMRDAWPFCEEFYGSSEQAYDAVVAWDTAVKGEEE